MEAQQNKETSQSCSSLFGAPTEQMVASGESQVAPATSPRYPTCPKVEGIMSQIRCGKEYFHVLFKSPEEKEEVEETVPQFTDPQKLADYLIAYHPLRKIHFTNWKVRNEKHHEAFDYITYLRMSEAVYKWSQRLKKLPVRKAPTVMPVRVMYTRRGEPFTVPKEYATYYSEDQKDENVVMIEVLRMIGALPGFEKASDRKFTYGNMEAALKMTEHIWRPLLKYKKSKDNWKYVITPTCYDFLAGLQDEFTGLAEAEAAYSRSIQKEVEESIAEEVCLDQPTPLPVAHGMASLNWCATPELTELPQPCFEQAEIEPMEVDEEPACVDPSCLDQPEDDSDLNQLEEFDKIPLPVLARMSKEDRHYVFDTFLEQFAKENNVEVSMDFKERMKETRRRKRMYPRIPHEVDDYPNFLTWKDMRMNVVRERFDKNNTTLLGKWDRSEFDCSIDAATVPYHFPVKREKEAGIDCLQSKNGERLTWRRYHDSSPERSKKEPSRVEMLLDAYYEAKEEEASALKTSEDVPYGKAHAGVDQQDVTEVEENTIFSDQRETVQDTGIKENQIQTTGEISMGEDQWTVKTMMQKPIPCYNVKWSTTDEAGTELLVKALPGDFIFGVHEKICSSFTYWRAHPKIRIQLNGTKFHAGRIMVVFIPRYNKTAQDALYFNYNSLTACPNVILDASFSNSGILEIPFTHEELYFNIESMRIWQTLGVLKVIVFNKLAASTGASNTLGLTIYASYENADLHIPKGDGYMNLCGYDEMKAPPRPKAHAEAVITSLASNALSGMMPKLGNVRGGSHNQDKPTDTVEISRWVPNTVTSLTYGEGLDRSCRLGLDPRGFTIPTADIISTTKDDMNLLELCKIPCRLATFTWQDTKAETEYLGQWATAPTYTPYSTLTTNPEIYRPSMLAYCSRAFKFWRGSLRYRIQVIATQMHSGRLAFIWCPGPYLQASWNKSYSFPTVIMDLQEKNEIEFDVSYVSERPWLRCDQFFDAPEKGENIRQTGYVNVFVLNRLVRPEGTPASISINVFVSAGEDFQLAVPGDIFLCDQVGETPKTMLAKAHSSQDTVVSTRQENNSVQSINKGFGFVPDLGRQTMGENCMDLKTLLRRYNLVYTNVMDGVKTTILRFPNTPNLSGVCKYFAKGKDTLQTRTMLAHFSQLFTFWRGSLRYKVVLANNFRSNTIVKVYHIPGIFETPSWKEDAGSRQFRAYLDHASSYGTEVMTTNIQGAIEFEIPFYTNMSQLTTSYYDEAGQHTALSSTGTVYIKIEAQRDPFAEAQPRLNFDLYQAAGDDLTLNYVRAPSVLGMKNESKKTLQYTTNKAYDPYPLPSEPATAMLTDQMQRLKVVPEDQEGYDTVDMPQNIKAHGFADYFKPQLFTKTEKLVDRLNGACDAVGKVVGTLAPGPSTGTDEESGDPDDDPDPNPTSPSTPPTPNNETNSLNFLAEWIKSTMSSLMNTLKSLPIFQWTTFNVTSWTPNFDIAAVVNALVSFKCCTSILTRSIALYSLMKILLGEVFDTFKDRLMECLNAALEALAGAWKHNGAPKAHSFSENLEWAGPLSAILAIVTFIATLSRLPNKKESLEMIRGLSEKMRLFNFTTLALSNISKLYNTVKETVQWLVEWIVMKIDSGWIPRLALLEGFEKVEEWAQKVDELEGVNIQDRCNYDLDFRNHVNHLVAQAIHYRSMLSNGKIGREAKYLSDLTIKCLKYGKEVENAKYSLPVRIDPFCVCIYGDTKVGKSGCITTMAMEIMDRLGYAQHNRWCPINCSEDYFTENYTQQTGVYWDDFAAFDSEEQFKNFFNLKANTQYPLNMAFRKGEYFNSDFIFMTTNVPHPQPNFIKSHAAFLRRRDVLVQVAYVDDEIEREARQGHNVVREDMSHVRFRLVDPLRARRNLTEWLTIAQLTDQLTYLAREHLVGQRNKVHKDLTKMHYVIPAPSPLPEVANPGYYTLRLRPTTQTYIPRDARQPDLPEEDENDGNDPDHPQDGNVTPPPQAHSSTSEDGEDDSENEEFQDVPLDDPEPDPQPGPSGAITPPPSDYATYALSRELIARHTVLCTMSESLFSSIDFSGDSRRVPGSDLAAGEWVLACDCEDKDPTKCPVCEEWESLRAAAEVIDCYDPQWIHLYSLEPLQRYLFECAEVIWSDAPVVPMEDPRGSRWNMIKAKLKEMFDNLKTKVTTWLTERTEILKAIGYFAKIFAFGFLYIALCATLSWGIHKCVCTVSDKFYHRCGVCGKWPALPKKDPNRKLWLEQEWNTLYDCPYIPGHVTPFEDEAALRRARLMQIPSQILTGTAAAQSTYSSTEVRGQTTQRLIAHSIHTVNQHVKTLVEKAAAIQYTVRSTKSAEGRQMIAVAVGGRFIMLPNHFFYGSVDGETFSIFHSGAWLPEVYDSKRKVTLPNKDICLYEMSARFHAHKQMFKHFISETEIQYVMKSSCSLVKLDSRNQRNLIFEGDCQAITEVAYGLDTEKGEIPIKVLKAYMYKNIPVMPGDCGSILVTHSSKVTGVYLGVHVAGIDNYGYTTLITRELLERAVAQYTNTTHTPQILKLGIPLPPVAKAQCSNLIPPGHFGRVGTVHPQQMSIQSNKSEIIPTVIYEKCFPHTTEPSVLYRGDPRLSHRVSPLSKGIAKYGQTAEPFPPNVITRITNWMASEIDTFTKVRKPQPLTLTQAIQGIPELDGYLPLPMDTSPGWPYVLSRPRNEKGKAYLFNEEKTEIVDPYLKKKFEERLFMAKLGERVESLWTDCLKDERRPLEKIASGSTRVFTIPPVDFCLLVRMFTLDFAEAVRNSRFHSFAQIGIDPQSLEWTHLWQRLSSNSRVCMAGDFSRFDGTIPPEIIIEIFKLIYYFLTGTFDPSFDRELWNILMVIADEIIHTPTLARDQVYVTHIGNPSGNPLTAVINSFANVYYLAAAWLELTKDQDPELRTLIAFLIYIVTLVYGDDNLLSVRTEVADFFNQETVSNYLQRYGIIYTNAEKSGITKLMPLELATFLKNGFKDHPDLNLIKVPVMSKQTIQELLNWTRTAPDQEALLEANINDALRFAYFHGEEYFRDVRERVVRALEEVGVRMRVPVRSEYHAWFLAKCGIE